MKPPISKPLSWLKLFALTGFSQNKLQKLMARGDFPKKPWTADKVQAWVNDREAGLPYPSGKSYTRRKPSATISTPQIDNRDYYTGSEVHQVSGLVHKHTLNMWIAKGIFPQRIPGQGNRWNKAEVDAWRSDRDKGYPMLYPIVHPPFAQEYLRWQATGQPLEDITYAWLPAKKLAVQWMNGRPRKGATTIELVQPSQQLNQEQALDTVLSMAVPATPTPGQSLQQVPAPVPGTCTNCRTSTTPGHIHCTTCEFLLKYGHQQKFNDRTAK